MVLLLVVVLVLIIVAVVVLRKHEYSALYQRHWYIRDTDILSIKYAHTCYFSKPS